MKIIPENIRRLMSPADRKAMKSPSMAETRVKYFAGQERELQKDVANYLNLRGAYVETDTFGKRTGAKPGRADFRVCYLGRWISLECKADKQKPDPEQVKNATEVEKAGGIYAVVYSIQDVKAALDAIDSAELRGRVNG